MYNQPKEYAYFACAGYILSWLCQYIASNPTRKITYSTLMEMANYHAKNVLEITDIHCQDDFRSLVSSGWTAGHYVNDNFDLLKMGSISALALAGIKFCEGYDKLMNEHISNEIKEKRKKNAHDRLVASATHGHPVGMVGLGILYRRGIVVTKDLDLARGWINLALDCGYTEAYEELTAINRDSVPKAASQNSGCFITTAVCGSFNKPDNCYELTMFRDFRDNWLMKEADGKTLVNEYYEIAPRIVERINLSENAKDVYLDIWTDYLKPCLSDLESGDNVSCKNRYTQMVTDLKRKYLI